MAPITNDQFMTLLDQVAAGWNSGDARLASDLFSADAIYIEPPDKQLYRGSAELYEFFGGDKGPSPAMKLAWHNRAFDEQTQTGFGEYTFEMNHRYHGVVVVSISDGKISLWREYQYRSELDWSEFSAAGSGTNL